MLTCTVSNQKTNGANPRWTLSWPTNFSCTNLWNTITLKAKCSATLSMTICFLLRKLVEGFKVCNLNKYPSIFSVFPFLQKNSLGASGFHFYLKVADTSAKYKLSASTQLETHLHCRAADTESSLALIFPRGHCTVISFKNHIIQINNHRRCLLPLWSLWLLI